MADAAVNLDQLQGNFKDQFHEKAEELIPDNALLQRENLIQWVPADKMNGEFYSVPTLLRSNQGVSYLGEGGSIQDLQDTEPGIMKEAQVKGSELNVRGQLSYKQLSQSDKSTKAFLKSTSWMVQDLTNVIHTRAEIAALYGQTGLGIVSTYTNVSGAVYDFVITEASFAPGIWIPLEGAKLEVWDDSGAAMLNGGGSTNVYKVDRVTTSSRTIRCTLTAGTGTPASPDTLHFKGSRTAVSTFNEMVGLYKQFTDTSSTLFNLDRSAYGLLQGNTYSVGGEISKGAILQAAMLVVDKGELGELTCLVSSKAWAVLAAEDMALRGFDSSYSPEKSKSGSKELVISKVGGDIRVVCHPMVKFGEAFLFNVDNCIWVGSSKPTFEVPGKPGTEFFRVLTQKNGVELQNMADMAIYTIAPSKACVLTGISYA